MLNQPLRGCEGLRRTDFEVSSLRTRQDPGQAVDRDSRLVDLDVSVHSEGDAFVEKERRNTLVHATGFVTG